MRSVYDYLDFVNNIIVTYFKMQGPFFSLQHIYAPGKYEATLNQTSLIRKFRIAVPGLAALTTASTSAWVISPWMILMVFM